VQTPATGRESLLDEFEPGGLSASKFATLVGIKYQTFAAWAARRRKQGVTKTPATIVVLCLRIDPGAEQSVPDRMQPDTALRWLDVKIITTFVPVWIGVVKKRDAVQRLVHIPDQVN
jgi:hypothetical protein